METAATPASTPASGPKIRYDGSACLNVRSVTAACKLLDGMGKSEEPMQWDALSNALWFVETCVTSKGIFFDGTVPKETADRASEAVGRLKQRHQVKGFEVLPITLESPQEILEAARDGLAESRLLIDNFQLGPADQPLPQAEHDVFVAELAKVRTLPEAEREVIALDWVLDAFRGSKCLAAIVANGERALVAAHRIYEQHDGQGPLITAALINRFRLNYVNQLATKKRSAYVPDPSFECITREHIRLFKDYLLERVVRKLDPGPNAQNILLENMRSQTPLPPIGLYALMVTQAKQRPGAILETAYGEFRQDTGLMELIWRNTKGGIALKKSKADDAAAEIEQYFYDKYKILDKQAAGVKVRKSGARKSMSYLVPAVLKTLVKAVSTAFGADKVIDSVWTVLRETGVEASVPYLSDRLLNEGCDSYISQYTSLKWDFQNEDAVQFPLTKLSEQVELVFGRRLA